MNYDEKVIEQLKEINQMIKEINAALRGEKCTVSK